MPKREVDDLDLNDSDDDFGPIPVDETLSNSNSNQVETTNNAKRKKKMKILEGETIFLNALPDAQMYEKSYMHRDIVTHIAVSKSTDFIITGSIDGHVKFWKKMLTTIEFVKHFQAHLGSINTFEISSDDRKLMTASKDKMIKFFDIQSFDMSNMLSITFTPSCACWLVKNRVAIADADSSFIYVYSSDSDSGVLIEINFHSLPVRCMALNASLNLVLSIDSRGMIEYWDADTYLTISSTDPRVSFKYKTDTDLYVIAREKTVPCCLVISPTGDRFVVTTRDKQIRVFDFASGKLKLQVDESARSYMMSGGNFRITSQYDEYEMGRRLACEKELESLPEVLNICRPSFDETGNFLVYGSLAGLKILNLYTSRMVRAIGVREPNRFLACALYQGAPKVDTQFLLSRAGGSEAKTAELLHARPEPDPTLIVSAFKSRRFYLFTRREPDESQESRDVLNEAPSEDERARGAPGEDGAARDLATGAVLHTTLGDIHLKLYPRECPKTVENFLTHSKNGYYNGVMFHRVIKGFMVQTGDPKGDGTGGESIWGAEFEDEFNRALRHDRPYTLSMANAGPNTNGSQFFITTAPTPWLDNKHTVFGRVTQGFDVVTRIESSKVNKHDRPLEPIKIQSVEVTR